MKTNIYILLGITVLLSSSCSTMQIDVPSTKLVQYSVKGTQGLQFNQTITFADYQTQYVKRSWNKGSKSAFGLSNGRESVMIGQQHMTNMISFSLSSATDGNAEVLMSNGIRSHNLFIDIDEKASVKTERYKQKDSLLNGCYAKIYLGTEEKPWQMQVNNADIAMYKVGVVGKILLDQENYYTVKTVIKTKPRSISKIPQGLQFENKNGDIVGAVSLINSGTIFLKSTNEKERLLMSSAALVLLLRDDFVD